MMNTFLCVLKILYFYRRNSPGRGEAEVIRLTPRLGQKFQTPPRPDAGLFFYRIYINYFDTNDIHYFFFFTNDSFVLSYEMYSAFRVLPKMNHVILGI